MKMKCTSVQYDSFKLTQQEILQILLAIFTSLSQLAN